MEGSWVKLREKKLKDMELKDVMEYLKAECSHCSYW